VKFLRTIFAYTGKTAFHRTTKEPTFFSTAGRFRLIGVLEAWFLRTVKKFSAKDNFPLHTGSFKTGFMYFQ
jgi:hypothetical protein